MASDTVLRFHDLGRSWTTLPAELAPLGMRPGGVPPNGPGRRRRWLVAGAVLMLVASLLAMAPAARRALRPAPPTDAAPVGEGVAATLASTPLAFVENRGQVHERVSYYVHGPTTSLYFSPDGVTFALTDATHPDPADAATSPGRWAVKLDFVGANAVAPIGTARAEGVVSYFGNGAGAWETAIPTSTSIVYRELWPGIDMVYEGTGSELKYSFVVHPGADPSRIRLAYRGAGTVALNGAGQVDVTTPVGGFTDDTPYTYQDIDGSRVEVPSAYALEPGPEAGSATFGIPVGSYDTTRDLVIDPTVLVYAGFIGGADTDYGTDIAVDAAGNAYVTGYTASGEDSFPVAVGPDLTHGSPATQPDAFVAKVRADGTGLVYAGYIGGDAYDDGQGIAVDGTGAAYVTGRTASSAATFPLTGGLDGTRGGYLDAFVAKVNPAGTGLVYAGYIGGSASDQGHSIAVDSTFHAYVGGSTYSSEATFPVTVGPDLTHNGESDAFVAKVDPAGTALVYAGYVGGSGNEFRGEGRMLAIDPGGSAYLTGFTYSGPDTFPVKTGPNLTERGGGYVAKVDPSGTGLVYAGYVPGAPNAIAVDGQGSAYLVGLAGTSFPATVGPDLTYNGFIQDGYILKVRPDGTGLVYAGFIGSDSAEIAFGVAVDGAGAAYVTGRIGFTSTLPTQGGFDTTHNGASDAFVVKVRPDGTGFEWGTFLGGARDDRGAAIAVDAAGGVYIAGETNSPRIQRVGRPVGPDLTYNDTLGSGRSPNIPYGDVLVAKISQTG